MSVPQKINQQKVAKKGQYIRHKNQSRQRRGKLTEKKLTRGKYDILRETGTLDLKSQRKRPAMKDVECKLHQGENRPVSVWLITLHQHREFVERMKKCHHFSENL